jgi:hypothetical protein
MNTLLTEPIAKTSPRFPAPSFGTTDFRTPDFSSSGFGSSGFGSSGFRVKTAGVLSLLCVLTAAFAEILVRGRLNVVGGLVAASAMIAVTLLFYNTLGPVTRSLTLLAMSFNLVGLVFEVLRLQPQGVNVAILFDGFYCILIGYLAFRLTLLPRILGALMVLGGLGWLTFLSSTLTNYLSPYNLALGVVGEAAVCVLLLVRGVDAQPSKLHAGVTGGTPMRAAIRGSADVFDTRGEFLQKE